MDLQYFYQEIDTKSEAIPEGCGFVLHSRGTYFSLTKDHPNALKVRYHLSVLLLKLQALQGGKRPFHTIIPALVTRQDELYLCYGVMGGFMQPQGHVQVLLNILRGFTTQAALDAPRFCISNATGHSEVYFEDGFPESTITALKGWFTILNFQRKFSNQDLL